MVVITIILLLLIAIPYFFTDKIEALIKEEGNKMLNAEFDFSELDISLIRNFPQASLTIEDFYLKGIGEFANDTLVAAKEVTATVNIMSLFGSEGFDISDILLDGVSVKAIVLPDGTVNWDVMKPSDTQATTEDSTSTGDTPFRIKLQKLEIDDFNLIYDDRLADMYVDVVDMNATCSGDFGNSRTLLKLNTDIESVTFRMGGVPFLNKAELAADMNIDADLENSKFTFSENSFRLNAIKAALDGWIALTDAGMDMDVKLRSNEIGFKEVLSLVPAIYSKDFAGLKTDGKATLNAWAKGSLQGENTFPQFEVDFDVKNAMFKYPSLPAGVDNINVSAKITNPGGSADNTIVNVNPLSFVMAGNPFAIQATVKNPVSDMLFDVAAKGKLDLGKIKDIYPLENMQLNGIVDADMSVNGRMSYIEKEQYEKVKASGNMRLNNMLLQMDDMPNVNINKSLFTFTPRYLQLSETTVKIGDNDITLDSKFENYIGYLLKGTTLKGNLNVKSNRFNLNDFMTADSAVVAQQQSNEGNVAADTVAMGIITIPDNIDFTMQAAFNEVLFDNMKFDDMKGLLIVKNNKVDMKNLSFGTMGGNVVLNGAYTTPKESMPHMNATFKLNNIGFAQAYNDLNVVRKLAPIFSGLTGDFSGNISIDTELDNSMSPVLSTLSGSGALSTNDLSLNNVEVIQTVADILKKPSLKDTRVKNLNIEFIIKDGRVTTKPFDVKLGDYKMNLSGSTGLDQSIDYKGTITIPASAGKVSQIGTVDMLIAGTFTKPKVSIDMESLAKKAASQAASKVLDKILGNKSDSTSVASDSTTTTPVNKIKEEVTKKALEKAFDLFKKKK